MLVDDIDKEGLVADDTKNPDGFVWVISEKRRVRWRIFLRELIANAYMLSLSPPQYEYLKPGMTSQSSLFRLALQAPLGGIPR